jgi:regulation of enolase protein 1 (concanavalin A-like superfamily)
MIRDGLGSGAAHGFMFATPGTTKGTAFQRRVTAGGESTHTSGPAVAPPYWVKLTRSGDMLTASTSPDGNTWSVVATETIVMGSTVEVGLAVSSHVAGSTARATFDQVSITAAP